MAKERTRRGQIADLSLRDQRRITANGANSEANSEANDGAASVDIGKQ